MTTKHLAHGVAVALVVALAVACDRTGPTAPGEAPAQVPVLASKKLSPALCSPGRGGFSPVSSNPYFPLDVGTQWIYVGEEDDEAVDLVITVLDLTRVVEGVTTRVVEERETVDGELLEVSWNYFAQASDGTVCYFGEDVDIYEEEEISHEGAWCADDQESEPGIIMPADPRPGMKFRMELAPGVAEDQGTIVGIGPIGVPLGRFSETIRIREFNPLDAGKGYKVFAAGIGLIVDGPVELIQVDETSGAPGQPIPTDQTCGL